LANDINNIIDFLFELDALKLVNRRSYVGGGIRHENSAEHSWHLAMACWSIARSFNVPVNEEKLIKLALLHDLGEIDAGDTFLYASTRDNAHVAERDGIRRLQKHAGNGIAEISELWEEQETGDSPETKLLKTVDRLLPFMLNVRSNGQAWIDNSIKRSQVLHAHAFIEADFPDIYAWIAGRIDHATAQGWLAD
jgi:putative hydrolases of HD superfamily